MTKLALDMLVRIICILILPLLTWGCDDESPQPGDTDPPMLISHSPLQGALDVAVDVEITAQFNEGLDLATVDSDALQLWNGATRVPGTVLYDGIAFRLTFELGEPLAYNTAYEVKLGELLADNAGNRVAAESWLFTTVAESGDALYRLTFEAVWSATTHPAEFPPNPHFSGLIGMTHASSAVLFSTGELASAGIKDMAERGTKTNLSSEIQDMITSGGAQFEINGGGINVSPGSVAVDFDISIDHSLVSVTSMLAPSPDWFVAISSVDLYPNGSWIQDTTITVGIYDAGTDSGATFTSPNQVSNPAENISMITEAPLGVNGNVAALGTMRLQRLQ